MLIALLALAVLQEDDPYSWGTSALVQSLERAGLSADRIDGMPRDGRPTTPESFEISFDSPGAHIAAADMVGYMYGCFELAERIDRLGAAALQGEKIRGTPYLATRAINPFLTLPWDEDKNEPIYDAAALTDPARWYFHDDDYWLTLFDEMARCRLNMLDLHGMCDIHTTRFPNLYAYFVDSPSFPEVGVAKEIKQRNLARLNWIIGRAHARGVKVGVMSYEASFYTPHREKVPYAASEENLSKYTREVVEAFIRGVPELDALGFRIGESGHGADFFNCYLGAVKASGRDIPLYTRSWITRKAQIVPLARASNDFTVEIKYNGEHWGPPYIIAGGRVPGWYSYSFEDYLSDSGSESAKKMWPGNVSPEGEQWPSEPYKILWQVRANGTHRIFPFYEPTWVRRSITAMKLGTATGFSVEPLNAFFPPSPRYYTADQEDIAFKWIHQRDEPYCMLWGRLGYDPSTPDEVLDALVLKRLDGNRNLLDYWKLASRVIPTAFTAYSLGPDHRHHAPELEPGGDWDSFVTGQPFDSHVMRSEQEELAYRALGVHDGRVDRSTVARQLSDIANALQRDRNTIEPDLKPPKREIFLAGTRLGYLAEYYKARFLGAHLVAISQLSPLDQAHRNQASAIAGQLRYAWDALAAGDFYKPFPDTLRMGTEHFQWKDVSAAVVADAQELARIAKPAQDFASFGGQRWSNELPALRWSADGDTIDCTLEPADVGIASLLVKPLASSTYFHEQPFVDGHARFERLAGGHLVAADLDLGGRVARVPDWNEATPYLVVPSRTGKTPIYYSSEEALAYLDPKSLDPSKHGLLFVAPRAGDFFWRFGLSEKRKLLDAVERGMTLLVMNQDFASGRYKFDWLARPPKIENAKLDVFDPAGAFGLEKVETEDILFQPIRASEGWEVFGNGGIAQHKLGQGRIVLVQARLQQRIHSPAAARDIKALLELGGRDKPLVIVDAGTENATFATSLFPDFCNALDIPFLTLGEVIANEQGLVTRKIAGVVPLDGVLDGKGPQMMREFLLAKVREKAERPVPATRAEFEARQPKDKLELMRSLGLDPLPERTPLKAQITNTLKRNGYRVEMLTLESRPGVLVTANVYVPDPLPQSTVPVILDPNGHWAHKKSATQVQMTAISQALRGYIAIAVDSPGYSFEGDAVIERRELGPHDDLRLTAASMNATSIYVWDLMRTLDYAATRADVDMTRVGITGASGGGLAAMYAFAADERITCAVPVCYATSLAIQRDNGCLCNHVPGALQIGDRADVLAIRAPAPVLVIGALHDEEFPPEGTRHTSEKLTRLWSLFDAKEHVGHVLVDSGHDYNQPMREAAIGFFDRWLRDKGDGSPVPEPKITPEPEDSKDLFAAREGQRSTTTMRQLAIDALSSHGLKYATWDEVVHINGGIPARAPFDLKVIAQGVAGAQPTIATFTSEPGLTIPALIYEPAGESTATLVLISEFGKQAASREFDVPRLVGLGYTCCCIDARGCGELHGLDQRLMTYLGTSPAFAMGWDAACAAAEMKQRDQGRVFVIGRGPCAAQAAHYAELLDPLILVHYSIGLESISNQLSAMQDDVELAALQPRAVYGRKLIPNSVELVGSNDWSFDARREFLRGQSYDLLANLALLLND